MGCAQSAPEQKAADKAVSQKEVKPDIKQKDVKPDVKHKDDKPDVKHKDDKPDVKQKDIPVEIRVDHTVAKRVENSGDNKGDDRPLVVIVAANSKTGKAILQALTQKFLHKVRVRAVVRSQDKAAAVEQLNARLQSERKEKIEVHVGLDIQKPESLQAAFSGASKAFILVPPTENRVEVAEKLIEGAQKAGVKHIVITSLLPPSGNHIGTGEVAKQFRDVEAYIQKSNVQWNVLRACSYMENFLQSKESIFKVGAFYSAYGHGKFSAVAVQDIGDCAAAILAGAAGQPNKMYDFTGPQSLSGDDYARIFTQVLEMNVRYQDFTPDQLKKDFLSLGWSEYQANAIVDLFRDINEGRYDIVTEDTKLIGGRQTSFEEWLRGYSDYFHKPLVVVMTGNSATGIATVRALLAYKDRVRIRAGVRTEAKAEVVRKHPEVEVVVGVEAESTRSLDRLFKGVDRAMIITPSLAENRVELTITMINAAHAAGVKQVLIISMVSAAADDTTLFGRQFRTIEKYLEEIKIPYTILRCTIFMDNLIGSRKLIKEHGIFYGAYGNGKFSAVAVKDIGRVAAIALVEDGHKDAVYHLTGPEALSGPDFAATFTKVLGYEVKYSDAPAESLKEALLAQGSQLWEAQGLVEISNEIKAGNLADVTPQVKQITGTQTTFEQWVRENTVYFERKAEEPATISPRASVGRRSVVGFPSVKALLEFKEKQDAKALNLDYKENQDLSKPLIVIASAASATGFSTVKALTKRPNIGKFRVRAAVRHNNEKTAKLRALPNIEVVEGLDARKPESLAHVFAGAKRAMIIAPNFEEERAQLTISMIDGAKHAGVEYVVIISLLRAEKESTIFAKQFRRIERHLETSGLLYTFLRCAFFMDNFLGNAGSIKASGVLYGSHGIGRFPAVAIDDIGRSAAVVLTTDEHQNKAYELTGPEALSGGEYCALLSRHAGYEVSYTDVEDEKMKSQLVTQEWPLWQAEGMIELFQAYRSGQADYRSSDVYTLTGQQTSFDMWLREHANHFRKA